VSFQPGGIDPRLVYPNLAARAREDALSEMAGKLAEAGIVRDAQELAERLTKREREGCTGVGKGVAFPHCRLDGISDAVFAVGRSTAGIEFGAADGEPITVLFLLLSPKDAPALHLQALARLTRLARTPGLLEAVRAAESAGDVVAALREADATLSAAAV